MAPFRLTLMTYSAMVVGTMTTGTLGGDTKNNLRLIADRPEFQQFFSVLRTRKKNSAVSELKSFLENGEIEKAENQSRTRRLAVEFFRELERLGVGEFRVGRRGMPTRFIWNCSLLEVAAAATPPPNASTEVETRGSTEAHTGSEMQAKPATRLLRHIYVLRENLTVQLELPVDFSETEANRLASFINTLPLKDGRKGKR